MLLSMVGAHHIQNDVLEQRMTIEHDLELVRAGCSGTGEYAACYHHNEAADRLADEVERLRAELHEVATQGTVDTIRHWKAKVDAMRPVVDAARAWAATHSTANTDDAIDDAHDALIDAVRALDSQ